MLSVAGPVLPRTRVGVRPPGYDAASEQPRPGSPGRQVQLRAGRQGDAVVEFVERDLVLDPARRPLDVPDERQRHLQLTAIRARLGARSRWSVGSQAVWAAIGQQSTDQSCKYVSVATGLRGYHFHRDHRVPGTHPPKQSGSGIFVELCPCWWSGRSPLVLRRVPACGPVTDIPARRTTKLARASSPFRSPNIQFSIFKGEFVEGSACGACELRSNSSEC